MNCNLLEYARIMTVLMRRGRIDRKPPLKPNGFCKGINFVDRRRDISIKTRKKFRVLATAVRPVYLHKNIRSDRTHAIPRTFRDSHFTRYKFSEKLPENVSGSMSEIGKATVLVIFFTFLQLFVRYFFFILNVLPCSYERLIFLDYFLRTFYFV